MVRSWHPPHILPPPTPPTQCPNLRELDLSECSSLKDSVFESLGSGAGPSGYLGAGELNPGGWGAWDGTLEWVCDTIRLQPGWGECPFGIRAGKAALPTWESSAASAASRLPPLSPPAGCPQLRVLKLGDCDGLKMAALRSGTLESLQLSQCRWLERVELDCPVLTQVRWKARYGWESCAVSAVWLGWVWSRTGLCPHR